MTYSGNAAFEHTARAASGLPRGRGERGATLIILLTFVILVSASVLLSQGEQLARQRSLDIENTAHALAGAKDALLGWSVAYPAASTAPGDSAPPGVLPFPDRAADGNYDGFADCFSNRALQSDAYLLGRFPHRGEGAGCKVTTASMDAYFVDGAGQPLWYAVSRNVINYRGGTEANNSLDNSINPGLLDGTPEFPWLRIIDGNGNVLTDAAGNALEVAAVIIAPGRAVGAQDRSSATAGPSEFLDTVTVGGRTLDNSDTDGCQDDVGGCLAGEEFVIRIDSDFTAALDDEFNDRLVYVTAEELMRVAERRVLGETSAALANCFNDAATPCGASSYPWMSVFADPATSNFEGLVGTTQGHLALLHTFGQSYTTDYTISWDPESGGTYTQIAAGLFGGPPESLMYSLAQGPHTFAGNTCTWETNPADAFDGRQEIVCSTTDPGWEYRTQSFGFVTLNYWINLDTTGLNYTGTYSGAAPTGTAKRTRTVTTTTAALPIGTFGVTIIAWYQFFGWTSNIMQLVVSTDVVPAATSFSASGINYDLDVQQGEVPQWFVDNRWHHYVYGASAAGYAPGGGGVCTSGVDCLSVVLAGTSVNDVRALAASPGRELAGLAQDRTAAPATLGSYFDPTNNATANNLFDRLSTTATFNDQVWVVDSNAAGYH